MAPIKHDGPDFGYLDMKTNIDDGLALFFLGLEMKAVCSCLLPSAEIK
jgi:hypothetical protein